MGNGIFVSAPELPTSESNALQEVVSNLEEGYSEYYDISDTEVSLCSSNEVEGNIENIYLVKMKAMLKANSVEEMDYYQGISDYYVTASNNLSKLKAEENQLRMNVLSSEQLDIYGELEEHIGEEQDLIFFAKETYPVDNETEKIILFENGMDYVAWEVMLPASSEELREDGYARMENKDIEYLERSQNIDLQQARASYSVDDAVTYMTTYTSNPSSCNVCSYKCGSKVDTTKYNSNYSYYVSEGSHTDCANYVSQGLCQGGLSTDDKWKAGSSVWINVSKLTDYMTSNGHWTSVTYDKVQKGDIVSFRSYSHVVMITAFDGTTYKYSGHTNDRKNAAISIKSSNKSSYNFYRVS